MARPRKTAAVLKLQGTYRKHRHDDRVEELPKSAPPKCPDTLTGEAAVEWRRVVKHMADCDMLHSLNRSLLTQYCLMWAQLIDSVNDEDEKPLGAAFHTSFRMIANDLGFTPQAMLKMPKKEKEKETGFTDGKL